MRVLVAEDDPSVSEALKVCLQQSGYSVDCSVTGIAADDALKNGVFDLVILDLGLPRLDGFEVLRRLRKRDCQLPVLILSAREGEREKVQGLDLGADDYLVKPFSVEELQARVRALLRRVAGNAASHVEFAKLSYDRIERIASVNGKRVDLSAQEAGVLEMLLSKFGKTVTKEQLVARLYSYERDVGYNAIEVYVHRLRKKIAGSGITVRTLYGRGYVIEELRDVAERSATL